MESNHHGVAPASPSSWCVYQFRHHRKQSTQTTCTSLYFISYSGYLFNRGCFLTQPSRFIKCKYYFFGCAGAGGAAGAGAGTVSTFWGTGAAAGA